MERSEAFRRWVLDERLEELLALLLVLPPSQFHQVHSDCSYLIPPKKAVLSVHCAAPAGAQNPQGWITQSRLLGRQMVAQWHSLYASQHRPLKIAFKHISDCFGPDFLGAQLTQNAVFEPLTQQQQAQLDKKRELGRLKFARIYQEYKEKEDAIQENLKRMDHSFELLVERFELSSKPTSNSRTSPSKSKQAHFDEASKTMDWPPVYHY